MFGKPRITRREFLKILSIAGVGVVIEVYLQGCSSRSAPSPTSKQAQGTAAPSIEDTSTPFAPTKGSQATKTPVVAPSSPGSVSPSLYLTIGVDNSVTITVPRSELGQGTRTALAMIVAEELCAEWSTVRIEQAPGDSAYGDQTTGGSTSIQSFYQRLRTAGAIGRELMVRAAAETWGVDPSTCYAEKNSIVHQPSGKRLSYSELVAKAGQMPLPSFSEVTLKKPEEFTIIGTNVGRYDNPQIVTGKAIFGMDIRLPGMLYATVARPPVLGGKLLKYDAANAQKVPGVRTVVQIDCGVAVVAENTWAAIQGTNALDLTWDEGQNTTLDSARIEKELIGKANLVPAEEGELVGVYVFPYFAHMTMEPMNCTADARADRCEVWVPTQNPAPLVLKAASLAGVGNKSTRVNVTLVGGGFGRRLEMASQGNLPPEADYVAQAVQISRAVEAPVQVVWTREDDLHHDLFHPISAFRVSARLDDIKTLSQKKFESLTNIPAGYWRSVTNPPDAFAHECFLDEYAAATKVDPIDLRRKIYAGDNRALGVIELAATKAGWNEPLPEGRGRGVAYHSTWGVTGVAQVAEVSVDNGVVRVHRVVCAIDCGLAINPDMVVAQMESGIVFGLTAVLKEDIRVEKGQVVQNNFSDYPILRFDEIPAIEVYLVPSDLPPSGVGEMGNPPLAPAVANAIFAATGKRIHRIPIRAEDLK